MWTLFLAVTGSGWSLTLAGLRFSSRDPFRSLVAGALLASIGLSGLRLQSPGERWLSAGAALLGVLTLLPLTMAAAKEVAGERGVFAVVPMLGALLVWLTYLLGRAIHSAEAGLLAAVALAASPIFLLYLMVAMTDGPVAAWWLAAVVLALTTGHSSAFSCRRCRCCRPQPRRR